MGDRLNAGPITAGHHRTGLLRTASGMVAAETSLVILPRQIPPHARAALAGTDVPDFKILAPLGVQRLDRRALYRHGCLDAADGDVAVQSSAVLALDGAKVAIATERITGDLCPPDRHRLPGSGGRGRGHVSAGSDRRCGIAGLTTALSLHAAGIEALIVESALELKPMGAGINLLPHAVVS